MTKLTIGDIVQILDAEILWCEENPEKAFTAEYRKGFVNGLIQSKYLIVEMNKKLRKAHSILADEPAPAGDALAELRIEMQAAECESFTEYVDLLRKRVNDELQRD